MIALIEARDSRLEQVFVPVSTVGSSSQQAVPTDAAPLAFSPEFYGNHVIKPWKNILTDLLSRAIVRRNVLAVDLLLRAGARLEYAVHPTKEFATTPLSLCASNTFPPRNPAAATAAVPSEEDISLDIVILSRLVEGRADVNARIARGITVLSESAAAGSVPACAALLQLKADPNIAHLEGRTPLHRAALMGHVQVRSGPVRQMPRQARRRERACGQAGGRGGCSQMRPTHSGACWLVLRPHLEMTASRVRCDE